MVQVTLPFENVTEPPNGIRVKYPYGNISQATPSALLKLPFLTIKARNIHLFDNLAPGLLLSLVKIYDTGCTSYFNAEKIYIFFQYKNFPQGVRYAPTNFLWKLNKDHNQYQ